MKTSTTHSKLSTQLSLIEYKNLRFLIFDAPSSTNIELYLNEFLQNGVTDVVRVCEPTYDKLILEQSGIKVHDWAYPDGDAPPPHICHKWLDLLEDRFKEQKGQTIGIHCVAGLGRAPALVALALIESGMAPLDSVIYVRERRRGAINAKQLKFLEGYKKRRKSSKGCYLM